MAVGEGVGASRVWATRPAKANARRNHRSPHPPTARWSNRWTSSSTAATLWPLALPCEERRAPRSRMSMSARHQTPLQASLGSRAVAVPTRTLPSLAQGDSIFDSNVCILCSSEVAHNL